MPPANRKLSANIRQYTMPWQLPRDAAVPRVFFGDFDPTHPFHSPVASSPLDPPSFATSLRSSGIGIVSARLLNGEAIAKDIRKDIAAEIRARALRGHQPPRLAVILVGDNPASKLYVRLKRRDCERVGMTCDVRELPETITEAELAGMVIELNRNAKVDGILIQLPLPRHISANNVVQLMDPKKDVDGVSPSSIGLLALREPGYRCCTPKGVMTLLASTGESLLGKDACVIGASNHVGRPMGLELLQVGCTVTTAHKYSRDARAHASRADILVSATGIAGLVTKDWVKPGAIVVDVGIEQQRDGRIRGDVEFEEVAKVASWITPVPGGVGPMTRVSVLENVMDSVINRDA